VRFNSNENQEVWNI